MAALLDLPDTSFVSLEIGDHADKADELVGVMCVDDAIDDFADTVPIIANLDIIVSVDTAATHLAGAFAKTVLMMLQHPPDFRWLHGRTGTPWYPTMTLMR